MTAEIARRNRSLGLALLALAGVALLPTLIFPLPPLMDYPNHLARLWLIAGGMHVPPLDRFYAEDWRGIATNIGIDVIAKGCAGLMPPLLLGRVLLALAVLLPPAGGALLHRALFGRWSPWQFLFFFFWSAETLLAGFLNFHLGLGMALMAAAADGHLRRWRHAARLTASFALIVMHPFSLLFYCALLAGIGLGAAPIDRADLRRRLPRAAEAAICLVPVATFFVLTRAMPGGGGSGFADSGYANVAGIGLALFSPFTSYDLAVDAMFFAPLVAFVVAMAKAKRFRGHGGLLAVAAILALTAPLLPNLFAGTGWIDRRLPIMAVLAGLAAVRPTLQNQRQAIALTVGLFAFVALRTAWIGWNWGASTPMVASMQSALAEVPAGARLLPMQHTVKPVDLNPRGRYLGLDGETFGHYGALAIVWRRAFVPMLFSQPGKQPVRIRPPYDAIGVPGGGYLPSVHALARAELIPRGQESVVGWRTAFDYVLVLNADVPDSHGPFTPPPELHMVRDAGFAQLYRIKTPR